MAGHGITPDELDAAQALVERSLATYDGWRSPTEEQTATFFSNAVLALDRLLANRSGDVEPTPATELGLVAASLAGNLGMFSGNAVVAYVPDEAVLGYRFGQPIRLTRDQFATLAAAVLAELRGD